MLRASSPRWSRLLGSALPRGAGAAREELEGARDRGGERRRHRAPQAQEEREVLSAAVLEAVEILAAHQPEEEALHGADAGPEQVAVGERARQRRFERGEAVLQRPAQRRDEDGAEALHGGAAAGAVEPVREPEGQRHQIGAVVGARVGVEAVDGVAERGEGRVPVAQRAAHDHGAGELKPVGIALDRGQERVGQELDAPALLRVVGHGARRGGSRYAAPRAPGSRPRPRRRARRRRPLGRA